MGHIQKRGNSWRARYRGPGGNERSRSYRTKREASEWLAQQTVAVADGSWTDPSRGRVSVSEWGDRWLDASPHLKELTRVGYRSALDCHIVPVIGVVPIAKLDKAEVKALIGGMVADGKGAGTVRNVKYVLSGLCRYAIDAGAIKTNPCQGVKTPRPPRDEMRFLTAEEVSVLADTIDQRWNTLVIFAAYSGLRAGEIGALRVGRLDLMRGRANVIESVSEVRGTLLTGPTKTYETRSVALPPFLRELLALHIAGRAHDPDSFVFQSPAGGQLRHSSWRRRFFDPAVRDAGLSPCRFHDLRHTCAALLIANGAHPRAIMERLGHSSVTVSLDRYGHLFPSLDEQLTDGLETTWTENLAANPRPQAQIAPFRIGSST